LSATLDDANSLANTAAALAGIYTAALSACGGLIVQQEVSVPNLVAATVTGFHLLGFIVPLVRGGLRPRPIAHPGGLAVSLSDPKFDDLDDAELIKRQALSYDRRIEANARRNQTTGSIIYRCMCGLAFSPVVFVTANFVARCFT
jgi:hypothetical protein